MTYCFSFTLFTEVCNYDFSHHFSDMPCTGKPVQFAIKVFGNSFLALKTSLLLVSSILVICWALLWALWSRLSLCCWGCSLISGNIPVSAFQLLSLQACTSTSGLAPAFKMSWEAKLYHRPHTNGMLAYPLTCRISLDKLFYFSVL